ncbi:MAG: bifunctional indole-3-glycerol-phosphate synthase TrpC/phosphoribosylanthranilate isomerase TrpF [Glaciecola sp.]|jgi:indole-3-glycerol phosphate synthase/phosphoribosylanthranilate isomerase
MQNVLAKIVDDKRIEVAAREAELPLDSFKAQLTPSTKSFYDALNKSNAGYILECKKASPSKGLIRPIFDLDEILESYLEIAACLSVLTDEKYFQGTYEYLEYVTGKVDIPVLNKDFFVNEYQIYLARHYNADAVLLMLSVLDDTTYTQLSECAASLDLDVLTEVSNEEEARRAVALGAKIIGINNRDLRDLSTDLATTERLVPLLNELGHTGLLISESGIYTRSDIARLAPHVNGFLVGSALMAQNDLTKAVRQLAYGAVKICGITDPQQALAISAQPVSYMGLIFAPKSKRCITIERAQDIVETAPFNYVGVFVNESIDTIVSYAKLLHLSAVQLHGSEDQDFVTRLRGQLPEYCQIWLALGVDGNLPSLTYNDVDLLLLDCQVTTQDNIEKGGTGQQFDWTVLNEIEDKSKIGLAGGLSPANITSALATQVQLLDVNSGVESAPGDKSLSHITQLFSQLRTY